jgi:organic hydroperoxide reductase OsmC/OhrA
MSQHTAVVAWDRQGATFTDNRYSRAHTWTFDGGVTVAASSSPHVVPVPLSRADAVDPEEAFVASLSACHLLWFLSIAAKAGYVVDSYRDDAVGTMRKNAEGQLWIADVELRPHVTFAGDRRPTAAEHERLHHEAHAACFLARSVISTVRCTPVDAAG